jgi:riboflavin kinase
VSGVPHLIFEGTVFSGKHEGKKFLELTWVRRQIQRKVGFTPYSGTLNLHLSKEMAVKRKQLQGTAQFVIEPEKGYCPGALYKAVIGTIECAIIIPQIPKYPDDVLEIISPVYLRGKLGLTDGSLVTIAVTF